MARRRRPGNYLVPFPRRVPRGVVRIPRVAGTVFVGRGQLGDFEWELRRGGDESRRTLYVYNENARQQRDKSDHTAGGGNAVIRPYRRVGCAIGMPTGFHAGFANLEEEDPMFGSARALIDEAIDEIVQHVAACPGRFDKIAFSRGADGLIGTGIFHVDDAVRVYITRRLREVPRLVDRASHAARRAAAAPRSL